MAGHVHVRSTKVFSIASLDLFVEFEKEVVGSNNVIFFEVFPSQQVLTRCLRIVDDTDDPLFTFELLPSGRYRSVLARVQIRANCFRACCVKVLNSVFHK